MSIFDKLFEKKVSVKDLGDKAQGIALTAMNYFLTSSWSTVLNQKERATAAAEAWKKGRINADQRDMTLIVLNVFKNQLAEKEPTGETLAVSTAVKELIEKLKALQF